MLSAKLERNYKEILELAVLKACEDHLDLLTILTAQEERSRSISDGLTELGKLKSDNIMPNYNHCWIALLHASWYHLRHVNFLQNELADRLKQHAGSDEKIRVIDFGCGTMPVMWAIALVLADPDNELTQQSVSIKNIDTSDNMRGLGYDMRAKLKEVIESRQDLDEDGRLCDAINRVKESEIGFNSDAHLLTAIHCLYDKESCKNLKMRPIRDKCVMLHKFKAKQLGLTIQKNIDQRWFGNLEKLTEFRKEKIGGLCLNTIPGNLINPVNWNSSDVVLVNL